MFFTIDLLYGTSENLLPKDKSINSYSLRSWNFFFPSGLSCSKLDKSKENHSLLSSFEQPCPDVAAIHQASRSLYKQLSSRFDCIENLHTFEIIFTKVNVEFVVSNAENSYIVWFFDFLNSVCLKLCLSFQIRPLKNSVRIRHLDLKFSCTDLALG